MSDARKFLDVLCDALGNSDGMTIEEVKQDLREEGVDVDGILERLKVRIKGGDVNGDERS